jgi:ribose transport system substrate-binding protein
MKRTILSLTVCAALLTLAACGSSAPEKKRIAVVVKALDSEFWLAVKSGVDAAAKEHPDLEVSIMAPQREIDIDQQVSLIEDQLVRKVALLVVAPAGVAQVTPVLDKAKAQGVRTILVDTDAPWPGKLSFVGTDNFQGGKMAAEFLVQQLKGKGRIVVIRGVPGVETHESRLAGFRAGLSGAAGMQIVAEQPANSERALAMTVMENILTSQKDLDAVFATSDQMALGALEAIQARHAAKMPLVVAFDAGKEVLGQIQSGKIAAAVAQLPYQMGYQSVKAAARVVAGETIPVRIDTGVKMVTRENAAEFLK